MKIKIAIPGSVITTDMDDKSAEKVFKTLVYTLLNLNTDLAVIEKPKIATEAADTLITQEILSEEENRQETPITYRYKGFMFVECEKCGYTHAYCIKEARDHSVCRECGTVTRFLKPLRAAYPFCECGKQAKYMTNLTASAFDINCIDCGAPVAVQYNQKKNCYDTMRRNW